jgi:hypothetical protein
MNSSRNYRWHRQGAVLAVSTTVLGVGISCFSVAYATTRGTARPVATATGTAR